MTDLRDIAARLETYVVANFLTHEQAGTFDGRTDLMGLLDSLQLLRTVVQLEALFDVKVEDSELTVDNLGSVEKLAALVGRKRRLTPAEAGGQGGAC